MTDVTESSRILTLVFTDLADSTALKSQRGDRAVAELIEGHRAQVRALAGEHRGRIVDWAGDGCFLAFDTPSAAVAFGLALEHAHASRRELPGVRIGMHAGEVTDRPGRGAQPARIEGLAVDLAARIGSLARPAQLLMSAAVADSARPRVEATHFGRPVVWRSHGLWTLKGIDEPVEIREAGLEGIAPLAPPLANAKAAPAERSRSAARVGAAALAALGVAALSGALWWAASRDRAPPPERKSIAVLPFVNMSSERENEYFSDGVTEDLTTALSKLSGMRVAARTSSFAFKGRNEAIETIAAQLHVDAILEGSVARAGDRVRITAQLVDARNGYHLWSDSYDRKLEDVFAIRSEVAQTVANQLEVALDSGERRTLERRPTEDFEAFQLYLKGRNAVATYKDFDRAAAYFQQAIQRDPDYALAYAGLALTYDMAADYHMPPDAAFPLARAAAERALALDPTLAEAHTWLGILHWWYGQDRAAARRSFETAVELAPEDSVAVGFYGFYLVSVGETGAGLVQAHRAVELDPMSLEPVTWLGMDLYLARRYPEAIEQLELAGSLDDSWWWRLWRGRAQLQLGRFDAAIADLEAARRLNPGNAEAEGTLGRAHAAAGHVDEARGILAQLAERSRREYVPATNLATIQIGLGDRDGAFESLARALEQRTWLVSIWSVDPELDPLRSDPRFVALLAKAGQGTAPGAAVQ